MINQINFLVVDILWLLEAKTIQEYIPFKKLKLNECN